MGRSRIAGGRPARVLGVSVGGFSEALRLSGVFACARVGAGKRSLAYSLRFRAPDRTLTAEAASAPRDAAVAVAAERTGATLRGADD
ncbi:hypothetical protein ACFWVC_08195 [Streptomyces sp. NPDC058691]|uniref:phenylalanine--tRNA ligase subunit beta-related protein n=1 Tax=Streptomyces sp. NPDC058691 TaxID=3346601 RepID=UPI00365BCAA1